MSTSGFTQLGTGLATGTESTGQTGRLSFLFTEEGDSVAIEMEGEVCIGAAEDKGTIIMTRPQ